MSNAGALRARAEELREVASSMDTLAGSLGTHLDGVDHARRPGLWRGAALQEIDDRIQVWFDRHDSAAEQLSEIAGQCRSKATSLDLAADEAELEALGVR